MSNPINLKQASEIADRVNVPTEVIESVLPELRHRYVVHLYQDSFDNWYASIKPDGKNSTKISVEFYLSYLMRKINLILHSMEYPES